MRATARPCPMCRKPVPRGSQHLPFCSKRCRIQDLANWATGEYAIPAPLTELDDDWEARGRDD